MFSGLVEACPLSCVLVVLPNGTCISVCRPVVLVDGTFLTGKYRGTLMMVVVVDPEDQIVPVAFALVEGENNKSWSWFMWVLCVQVLGPSHTICLISDHHPGLLNATAEHIDGSRL